MNNQSTVLLALYEWNPLVIGDKESVMSSLINLQGTVIVRNKSAWKPRLYSDILKSHSWIVTSVAYALGLIQFWSDHTESCYPKILLNADAFLQEIILNLWPAVYPASTASSVASPNLYEEKRITQAWTLSIRGHVSYPTGSPTSTSPGLWSSVGRG